MIRKSVMQQLVVEQNSEIVTVENLFFHLFSKHFRFYFTKHFFSHLNQIKLNRNIIPDIKIDGKFRNFSAE